MFKKAVILPATSLASNSGCKTTTTLRSSPNQNPPGNLVGEHSLETSHLKKYRYPNMGSARDIL